MTREEYYEIHNKYHLRLTGHEIWIGYLYHLANIDARTMADYRIAYSNQSKSDPRKEVFENFVQEHMLIIKQNELIIKQNEVTKRINKMKGDFE